MQSFFYLVSKITIDISTAGAEIEQIRRDTTAGDLNKVNAIF